MKWVTDRIGKKQTWYSSDIVLKIWSIVGDNLCEECDELSATGCTCGYREINDILENEDYTNEMDTQR